MLCSVAPTNVTFIVSRVIYDEQKELRISPPPPPLPKTHFLYNKNNFGAFVCDSHMKVLDLYLSKI